MADSPAPTAVTFFFDPACPWTWVTSRWLVAAVDQRDLTVTWRPYSLLVKNGDDMDDEKRTRFEAGHRALRVVVALDRDAGNNAAGAFYAERGHRAFTDGQDSPDLAATLTAAGLDAAHAGAADDEGLDAVIESSMDDAHRLAGAGSGSPILSVDGVDRAYFGPVLTAVPDGDGPGRLWDHLRGLWTVPEFHEFKRDRADGPTSPARP
jgi:2-hydroxychromene-2-carboxylate isomerase